ncbi:hypothetical protein Ddc_08352 [Ditylenchus destructor]|nr:hypothetical protein Ddc_08352 [Ditylenchus destructor]
MKNHPYFAHHFSPTLCSGAMQALLQKNISRNVRLPYSKRPFCCLSFLPIFGESLDEEGFVFQIFGPLLPIWALHKPTQHFPCSFNIHNKTLWWDAEGGFGQTSIWADLAPHSLSELGQKLIVLVLVVVDKQRVLICNHEFAYSPSWMRKGQDDG